MKLGKEEIQKLVLGVLILLGAIYCYFAMLLSPEMGKQAALKKDIEKLGPEIASAKAQIKKTQEMEKAAPEKTRVVPQVREMIPDGSPVAWFPTRMTDFFKRQGIDRIASKINSESLEKDLTGFRRLSWVIDIPKVDFVRYGNAICALENEEVLTEISNMQVDVSHDEVETQHAFLTLNSIVKQ